MKKILTSIALTGLLITNAFSADAKTNEINKNAVIKAEQKAQNQNQLVKEAINAIRYTQDALIYLDAKKNINAKNSLKKAIGELSDVLNSPNAPYLLPVDVNIEAYEFKGNIHIIKNAIEKIKNLISQNKLPQARTILNTLRDEIVIKTTNLPLATYPAALNLALKYINEGKIKEAKDVLAMALSTLVEVDTIIPIPLIKAQALVSQASKFVKKDKKETIKILEEAKNQLKLAKVLGYSSTSITTYQDLKTAIEKIEKEIKLNHKTNSLFEKLIQKLKEFKEKAITHTSR